MSVKKVYLVRCNGALVRVYATEAAAVAFMRVTRKNSEFWRITEEIVYE